MLLFDYYSNIHISIKQFGKKVLINIWKYGLGELYLQTEIGFLSIYVIYFKCNFYD